MSTAYKQTTESHIFTLLIMLTPLIMLTLSTLYSHAETQQDGANRCCVLNIKGIGGAVQDHRGLIWIATWNGLCCYDGYNFHNIKMQPGDGTTIGSDHIRDILMSPKGMIWCHTDDEIFEFNPYTFRFRDLPQHTQDSIAPCMGKRWRGLSDMQEVEWSTDEWGLYKTTHRHHPARVIDGTQGMTPRALSSDSDGNILVGFKRDNCIKVFNQDGKCLRTISTPFSPYCILQTKDGDIWTGGKPGGLIKLGGRMICDEPVYDIKQDRMGRLWIATFGNGIKCCTHPNDDKPTLSPSLGGKRIRKILITEKGNLIAATTEGLMVGNINNQDIRKVSFKSIKRDGTNKNSLMSNAIMDIAADSKGRIFVATESSGTDMVDEESLMSDNPMFYHLSQKSRALPIEKCQALTMVDDSLLIMVGNDNLLFYYPQKDDAIRYESTFWNDSCLFAEVEPMITNDGCLWVCSLSGLLRATPHHLYTRGFCPPLIFTTISVNGGNEVFSALPDTLRLNADERNISLQFAAINHISNSKILYRSSFDSSPWTSASQTRRVDLYDITPGWHVIRIQSTDSYGRWVNNTRTMVIYVRPYWHETWWANSLFLLILVAILYAIAYCIIYIRRIKKQKSQLLEQLMSMIDEKAQTSGIEDYSNEHKNISTDERHNNNNDNNKLQSGILKAKPEDISFLNCVREYIENNISNSDANIEDMASYAAVSRSTLNRRLRSLVGISATQLLIEARMKKAEELIANNDLNLYTMTEIAEKCGYSDVNYFKSVIKKRNKG